MSKQDSNDEELDKLISELEKDSEESSVFIEKQVKRNKDEVIEKKKNEFNEDYDDYTEVGDEMPTDETGDMFW